MLRVHSNALNESRTHTLFRVQESESCAYFQFRHESIMREEGIEPSSPQGARDFKSLAVTNFAILTKNSKLSLIRLSKILNGSLSPFNLWIKYTTDSRFCKLKNSLCCKFFIYDLKP